MPRQSHRGAANTLRILQIVLMVLLQLALPLQGAMTATAAEQAAPAALVASAPEAAPLAQETATPGVCSNDPTKACATSADCGGNACYIPTAGGQTLDNQVCMATAFGAGLTCTANDVRIADTSSLQIVKACGFPGDYAVVSFVAEFELTTQDRYDVGVWVSQDGGNALTGKCSVSDFPISPTPPWTNLDASAQPSDTCGDISQSNNPVYSSIQNIRIDCEDTNGDGKADINACLSWRQSGANDVCDTPLDAFPGSPSKCNCQKLPGLDIPVPGVIKVDKVTYDADGNAKPGDPTSFPFTLSGGPDSISKSFSLTDAAAPYSSVGLKPGTYAVAESAVSGWTMFSATCVSDKSNTQTPGAINLHNGETVTCTFKNKVNAAPHLSITKAAAETSYSKVGDVVHYTIVATNDGNVTLAAVTVTDPKVSGLTCTPANGSALAPGAKMTCTATHTVTQADLDAGHYANTACVDDGAGGAAQACASKDVPGTQTPAISLTKAASTPTYDHTGQLVGYTLVAKNVGNVTLTNVTIADPKLGALVLQGTASACGAASLATGATITCTGDYSIKQSDLDFGSFTNTATATGVFGDQTVSADATVTINADQNPALSLAKSANPTSYSAVGQQITYTYVLTNTGNVTLSQPFAVTDDHIGSPLGTAFTCGSGSLAPGDTRTCTATYTITQADLDAGSVTNHATATAKHGNDTITSNQAQATVTANQTPHLQLQKVANPTTYDHVGQVITYTYTLTNNNGSNVTLNGPFTITDDKATVTCPNTASLAPHASITCTATYTITQADLDNGSVTNHAIGHGFFGTQPIDSNQATATVTALQNPALSITKTAAEQSFSAVGDVIHYTIVATNVGNVTLHNVTVVDPKVSGLTCSPAVPVANLAPGATISCTATHTVVQADLDAGHWANQACVDDGQGGAAQQCASKDVPGNENPHITIVKSVAEASFTKAGDVLHYTMVATNDGNVTLHNVTITDALLGTLTCTPAQPATLAPGATLTCTGTYTVKQSDVDAGHVFNTALAEGKGPQDQPVSDEDSKNVPNASLPHISLTKTATPHFSDPPKPGDTIGYTLVATNDDDVTLYNVVITDAKLGALTCTPAQPAVLSPGESLTCTGSYTLTQADIDAGKVDNTALVTSRLPSGANGPSAEASAHVPVPQAPHLSITKDAEPETYDSVGDVINYTIVATNDGNVTLHNVTIADPMFASLSCTPANGSDLAPAGVMTCTATHTITQADLDAGKVDNTACVDDGAGGAAQACASEEVNGEQTPAISLTKTPDLDTYDHVGQVITYTLVAKNVGNVTLHDVTITDPKLGALTCMQPATLAPGETLTCTGTHAVVQADLDAGQYDNTATVNGKGPKEQPVSAEASATVFAIQDFALEITKTATETGYSAVGDVLHYTIVATNVGNTTLHDVTVSDPLISDLACTPAQPSTLAPTESMTCTATHTVTQADLDAGHWANQACVDDGQGGAAKVCADHDVPGNQTPHVALAKTTTTAAYDHVGQVIPYTLVATNDGNVTLHDVIITDEKLGTLTCTQPAVLAPTEKLTCTGSHTVTQADLDAGQYDNTAIVNGKGPQEQPVSATASATVPATQKPALSLTKKASPTTYQSVGNKITYTYVLTNSGNVTLSGQFWVSDDKATVTCPNTASLAPGASITCTATYTIASADLASDVDSVTNHAVGHGFHGQTQVDSNEATATVFKIVVLPETGDGSTTAAGMALFALALLLVGLRFRLQTAAPLVPPDEAPRDR